MIKVSFIRKMPNGKWRVVSRKGKNLGEYDSRSAAVSRLKAIEYFKHNKADRQMRLRKLALLILSANDKPTYSSTMRELNKENNKNKIKLFMETFKKAFDEAHVNNMEDEAYDLGLISALKSIKD